MSEIRDSVARPSQRRNNRVDGRRSGKANPVVQRPQNPPMTAKLSLNSSSPIKLLITLQLDLGL